ncbi:hypothetical protein N234_36220 [Ralstonia pickettii DTP0602]|nr:hypothetical protein N234_36220 [Ralstonia pickettii DTP0602]
MTSDGLLDRILKNAYQYLEGRHERVGWIFRGQPTQCFTPGGGIALLKRGKHVIAKHDIAAMFEEIELIRHGVQVGMPDSSPVGGLGITGRQQVCEEW